MINSRWPRPIGISASIALSPVAIGSAADFGGVVPGGAAPTRRGDRLESRRHRLVHRFARDDAGRLDVDAGALIGLDRALAVDRLAERVDDAAQEAPAHRHLDDGGGAVGGVGLLA